MIRTVISIMSYILRDDSSLEYELRNWATANKVTHTGLRQLLMLLRRYHPSLPKDPRTLLRTDTGCKTTEIEGGFYYHFGLETSLVKAFECAPSINVQDKSCLHHRPSPVKTLVPGVRKVNIF